MKYLIYFVYQGDGRIEDYVPAFLESVRDYYDFIHVIFNGEIREEYLPRLELADKVQQRSNDEFDVGAYKDAIFANPDEFYQDVDELTLANFTFFAPVGDMKGVFDWAENQDVDFWGLSAHKSMTPNPFTQEGELPYHINSHWITVGKKILQSPDFLAYWREMPPILTYMDSVLIHESQFTRHFAERGYSYALYMDDSKYESDYPAFNDVAPAVEDGFPIIKRRLFYHTPTTYMDRHDVNVRRALDHAKDRDLYDLDLVWDSVAGTVDPSVLYQNADLMQVVPDQSFRPMLSKDEERPISMILMLSGRMDADQIRKVISRITFDCNLIVLGDSNRSLAAFAAAAQERPQIKSCETEYGADVLTCFAALGKRAEQVAAQDETVLFALASGPVLKQYEYGMRHVARDGAVAALSRQKIAENRFFGLGLPAIKTFGADAETEFMDDQMRNQVQLDLSGFSVTPKLDGHVLFSTAGVFWVRAALLLEIATEIVRYMHSQPQFSDAVGEQGVEDFAEWQTDGEEIETFLSVGLPFFAAERRLITIALSNTAELPRNFIKVEDRYRALSEQVGEKDPFLLKSRIDYLLQFNSQEDRQAIFSDIHTRAFHEGWKLASTKNWDEAYKEGRKAGLREQRNAHQGRFTKKDVNQAEKAGFDLGYKEAWQVAFDKGYGDAWSTAFEKGQAEGNQETFDRGYQEGWNAARGEDYEASLKAAFDQGFEEGWKQSDAATSEARGSGVLSAPRRGLRALKRNKKD